MGSYAYEDAARKHKIYAEKCPAKDKTTHFFCWNSECMARVKLSAANSVHMEPYFRLASDEYIHTGWCENENLSKGSRNYDNTDFNFNNIINGFLSKKAQSTSGRIVLDTFTTPPATSLAHTKPRSIVDLYQICKSLALDEKFGDIERKRMLCDNKSNYFYTKGILGHHLIECSYHRFDPATRTIFFKYPCNHTLPNQYSVGLTFSPENIDTFQRLVNFFLGCPVDYIFVIAGDFKRKCSFYISECASKKAVYII